MEKLLILIAIREPGEKFVSYERIEMLAVVLPVQFG